MCTSSSVLIDKEDMTLGKSCLQLNKHSLLHLYSSRLQCTELYICNIINYLSIKENRKSKETKVKKKKASCIPPMCLVFSYKYWIHEPLPKKVIHFNWNETQ